MAACMMFKFGNSTRFDHIQDLDSKIRREAYRDVLFMCQSFDYVAGMKKLRVRGGIWSCNS